MDREPKNRRLVARPVVERKTTINNIPRILKRSLVRRQIDNGSNAQRQDLRNRACVVRSFRSRGIQE